MTERITFSASCCCGSTVRMSSPKGTSVASNDDRAGVQAEVARAFIAAHSQCHDAALTKLVLPEDMTAPDQITGRLVTRRDHA